MTLARFSSGDLRRFWNGTFGLGRVIMFASPLHTNATNLPLKVSFLPMIHSLIVYLTTPAEIQSARTGENLRLRLGSGRSAVEKAKDFAGVHWTTLGYASNNGGAGSGVPREIAVQIANGLAAVRCGSHSRKPAAANLNGRSEAARPDTRDIAVNSVDPEEGTFWNTRIPIK